MEIKIGLLESDAIILNGQEVSLANLQSHLNGANAARDLVLYYKEGHTSTPRSAEIVKLLVDRKLPVSLSTKPDYSDYVDRTGRSHPRPVASGAKLQSAGESSTREWESIFAEARNAASSTPEGRGVALIGADGKVMVLPAPARSAAMDAQLPKVPDIPMDRPLNIAVIANVAALAGLEAGVPAVQEVAKAIPFFGLLIAFAYAGHKVWAFGAEALAAGIQQAQILVIDSVALESLQPNWMPVAQSVMDAPRSVLIHSRQRYALLPAVPAATPHGWSYSEPDGEASYINCLLTTLAKRGAGASVQLVTGTALPDLADLTDDAAQLQWIAALPFSYDRLEAGKAIEVLTAKRSLLQKLAKGWTVKTVMMSKGERKPIQFNLRLSEDGTQLSIGVGETAILQ